jgi:transposase-like protein
MKLTISFDYPRPERRFLSSAFAATGHLDEVFLKINGKQHYLWRAVDQHGNVLDILVQSRRNKKSAKKFFRKLLKGLHYVPLVIITDKLKGYAAAKKEIMPGMEHRQHKGLNNRAENSHQPTRQRERTMRRFKSPGHAQRFLSAFGLISDHFRPRRHRLKASEYRALMRGRFQSWNEVTNVENSSVTPYHSPGSSVFSCPLVLLFFLSLAKLTISIEDRDLVLSPLCAFLPQRSGPACECFCQEGIGSKESQLCQKPLSVMVAVGPRPIC